MKVKTIALIPTRLESKRLPGKALLKLNRIPIIVHTAKRTMMAKKVDEVYVCTDNIKIIKTCNKYKIKTIKTKKNFKNGTERIASVAARFKNYHIIDVQGDEPFIDPKNIDLLVEFHKKNQNFDIVVPYLNIEHGENKNIVKIVSNTANKILYFSRAKVPFNFKKKQKFYKKHLSIISFKYNALNFFSKSKESNLEKIEGIELMRAIENGFNVGTFRAKGESFAVDKLEDYHRAMIQISNDKISKKYS